MILDKYSEFCAQKDIASASGNVGNVLDLKADYNIGVGPNPICHITADGLEASGAKIKLVAASELESGEMPSSPDIVIAEYDLEADENGVVASFAIPAVPEALRYMGLQISGTVTAGKLNASVVYSAPHSRVYPKG